MELQFHLVPASKQSAEAVWRIPDAVCTVLNSWWWTERPSETCRVLLQNKINLRNWCIWLVLLYKYITMHGPINVNNISDVVTLEINARCIAYALLRNQSDFNNFNTRSTDFLYSTCRHHLHHARNLKSRICRPTNYQIRSKN